VIESDHAVVGHCDRLESTPALPTPPDARIHEWSIVEPLFALSVRTPWDDRAMPRSSALIWVVSLASPFLLGFIALYVVRRWHRHAGGLIGFALPAALLAGGVFYLLTPTHAGDVVCDGTTVDAVHQPNLPADIQAQMDVPDLSSECRSNGKKRVGNFLITVAGLNAIVVGVSYLRRRRTLTP
jgi:hypothetical protein